MTKRRYVGLTTRAVAFALDAALINLVAILVAAGAALIVSVLHLPSVTKTILAAFGAGAYALWTIGYFVVFWSTTGQTPGDRAMRFRVAPAAEGSISPGRALVRFIGVLLAALPLFAGYVLILFDDQRRGLHDRLARTVVIDAPQPSAAERRRSARGAQVVEDALSGLSPDLGDDRGGVTGDADGRREQLTSDSASLI